jgi:hypothetical protein
MPVVYTIDKRRGIIRTRCYGFVTLPEVIYHFGALASDPDCPSRLDVVLDLSDMTSLPSDEKLKAVTDEIRGIRDRVVFGACAIVASSDPLFGTARVFEVLAARSFQATGVFRSPEDAEEWLAEQRSQPS